MECQLFKDRVRIPNTLQSKMTASTFLQAACALLCLSYSQGLIHLEPLNVDPSSVTVSGISSGAAMATQLHVALSSTVHGAALFGGVPYYCANGLAAEALVCMGTPGLVAVSALIAETNTLDLFGSIDSTSNLVDDPVYIFSGSLDTVVLQGAGQNVEQFYEHYGAAITTEYGIEAEHCQPTDFYGAECSFLGEEFINDCSYDGAYNALNALYGDIDPGTGDEELLGTFDEFDQSDFFTISNPSQSSMDDTGYVYIPSACVGGSGTCRLHVVLHGCSQGRYLLGDVFARNTGYLQLAEVNNIVMVFPQAIDKTLVNSYGCWDWWGYTGTIYLTKSAPQIVAIKRMIDAILG